MSPDLILLIRGSFNIAIAILSIFIGYIVYKKDKGNLINRTFFRFAVLSAFMPFSYAMRDLMFYTAGEFWERMTFFSAILLPAGVEFALAFKGESENQIRKKTIPLYVITLFVSSISFTNLGIKGFNRYPTEIVMIAGKLDIVYRFFLFTMIMTVLYIFAWTYRHSHGEKRKRSLYLLVGLIVYALGGIVFGVVPQLFGYHRIGTALPLASLMWISITAYTIVKHRVIEFETFLFKSAVFFTIYTITLIPIYITSMLFKPALQNMSMFLFATLITLFLFAFMKYHSIVREKISSLLKFRKYKYRDRILEFVKNLPVSHYQNLYSEIINYITSAASIKRGSIFTLEEGDFKLRYSTSDHSVKTISLSIVKELVTKIDDTNVIDSEQIPLALGNSTTYKEATKIFKETESELMVISKIGDEPISIMLFGEFESGKPYKYDDIKMFEKVAMILAPVIFNEMKKETLVREEKEIAEINTELKIARGIQESFLPVKPLKDDGLLIAGYNKPAKEVSGDFYGYFKLDDKKVAAYIGDVSGKNIPSALVMMLSNSIIKSLLLTEGVKDLGKAAKRINEILYREFQKGYFVTVFICTIDRIKNTLKFVNAGHEYALFYDSKNGRVEFLNARGKPFGVVPDNPLEVKEMRFSRGDILLMFTDGVSENMNSSGEMYGYDRLKNKFQEIVQKQNGNIIADLIEDITHFSGNQQFDDITLLMCKL